MSWRRRVSEVKEQDNSGANRDIDRLIIKEDGEFGVRFFPFQHKVTQADIQLGRYTPDELGQTVEELFCETRTHWIDRKPHTCGKIRNQITGALVGQCEHCDTVDRLFKSQFESDKAEAKKLKANEKYAVNVVVVQEDGVTGGVQIYDTPKSLANKFLASLDSRLMKGKVAVGPKGRDCLIIRDKSRGPAGMYDMAWLEAADSKPIEGIDPIDLFAIALFVPPAFRTLLKGEGGEEEPAPAKEAPKKEEPPKAKVKAAKDPWMGKKVVVKDDEDSIEGKVVSGPVDTPDGPEYTIETENGDRYGVTTDLMEIA